MARNLCAAILVLAAGCSAAAQLGVHPSTAATAVAADAPRTGVAAGSESMETASAGGHGMLAVPNVIGKTPEEARALVKAAGFTSDVELNPGIGCEAEPGDPPPREGRVNCQTPDPGKPASSYAMIQISVATRDQDAGRLLETDLNTVVGLTVDEARQRLKELGHTGVVKVRIVDNVEGCSADGRVCEYRPTRAMTKHDEVELILNRRKLDISTPAP